MRQKFGHRENAPDFDFSPVNPYNCSMTHGYGIRGIASKKLSCAPWFLLLLLFPPILSANDHARETGYYWETAQDTAAQHPKAVALLPFWGDDADAIAEFGDEVYLAMTALEGFRPVLIDMDDPPPDVPRGGFPPFVSPSPSLTGDAPFAITGSVFVDPASGLRHLRLYLWEVSDYSPIFTDKMLAPDRGTVAAFLPIMLRWLFSWIPGEDPEAVVVPQQIMVEGQQVIVYRDQVPVPNNRLYFGLRAGGNAQIFDPRLEVWSADSLDFNLINISAAFQTHLQFLPFRLNPGFLFLGLQLEGIATWDFDNEAFSLTIPALLRITARRGTSSFFLLGGPYFLLPMGSDPGITFNEDEGIGPFAGWGYTFGFGMGNRVGRGNLFMELRWSHDLVTNIVNDMGYFRRSAVSVSVGYDFGFFERRR